MDSLRQKAIGVFIASINYREQGMSLEDRHTAAATIESRCYQKSAELSTVNPANEYILECLRVNAKLYLNGLSAVLVGAIHPNRLKCITMFRDMLPAELAESAVQIEEACYRSVLAQCLISNYIRSWDSEDFIGAYSARCSTVYAAIDPKSAGTKAYGRDTLEKLLAGSIEPSALGTMSSVQLSPNATAKERMAIDIRLGQAIVAKESKLYQCPNCRERRATYREVQTRSSDEPADIFCTCLNCFTEFRGR